MRDKSEQTLLVDGYNVVNAWPELMDLANLEHARDTLVDILAGYGAYKNYKVVLVFDAHAVPGAKATRTLIHNVEVVFTSEGETADSYIEKAAYCLVRQGERVHVVTSDWAEQLVILGVGAYRIPARELIFDIKRFRQLVRERYTESAVNYRRHELGNRLKGDIMKRLDDMRRGR